VLYLPTYAATAWYHKRLDASQQKKPLRKLLDEVETFAATDYAAALFQGRKLSAATSSRIAETLAGYTGLSIDYLRATRLRIEIMRFCKELLRSRGHTVGRLDSRYTAQDRDDAGETMEFDPAYAAILGPYATGANDYMRRTLAFASDTPYNTLASLYLTWDWSAFSNRYTTVSDTLRKAMAMNPHLEVLVANGYYDLATPHFASDHTFNHLALSAEAAGRIRTRYYEAGHMMYVHQPSLAALAEDLRAFVRG
jgi:carboxypeptidase C (cathepsin A)